MKIGIIVDKKRFNIYYSSIKKYLEDTKSKDKIHLIKRVSIKEGESTYKTHVITSEKTTYVREKLPHILINMSSRNTKESNKVLKNLLVDKNYHIINYLNIFNQLRINEILLDMVKSDKIIKLSKRKRYENEIYTNIYGLKDFYSDTVSKRYYFNNLFIDNIRGYETYINIFNDTIDCNNAFTSNSQLNERIKGVFNHFHNNIQIYKVTFLKTLNGDFLHQVTPYGFHNKDYKYIDQVINTLFNEIKDVYNNENV